MRGAELRAVAAALLVTAAAAPAWAQDYTVTSVSGQYVSPPSSGTTNLIAQTKSRDNAAFLVSNLSFPIFYFGEYYSSMSVCTNGYVQFGTGSVAGSATQYASNFPLSGSDDGICAAAWDDLDGFGLNASLVVFTDGTAPNRRIIVDWSGWQQFQNTGSLSFQIQFHETSGRITMAYGSGWSGQTRAKAVGIDALSPDTRYVTPDGSSLYTNSPISQPANDWRFDPRITNFSGRALYDRLVVDSSGIGGTSEQNLPLAGLRVEVRTSGGKAVASGTTSPDGDFAVRGMALDATLSGSLFVVAQGDACTVRSAAGAAPYAVALATSVGFGADQSLGALSLTGSNDPGGAGRAPLHVARTIQGVADWCAARTADAIDPIDALYDTTSSAVTGYAPAGTDPAALRVGAASANPDAWDSDVLRKTYARHVLAAIAAAPTSAADTTFDKATDAENAFAEALGCYLAAAQSGSSSFVDGRPSSATILSLESPTLSTARGPTVAGWVAAALFDLVDGANESWDSYDGAGGGLDRVIQTVDALDEPVTAESFYETWGDLGFAGADLARNFIHHGLLGDDADEPNATEDQRKAITGWGFARTGRVLNLYDEDWYEVTLPASTAAVTVDVVWDRGATDAEVGLTVRSPLGAVLATGSFSGPGAPLRATFGPQTAPATYRVRVAHLSGGRVDAYALQVFSELTMSADAFRPWTVDRPYDVPVAVTGGIPPYALTVEAPFVKPPGLILDGANLRVTGAPTAAGTYDFSLTTRDSASPNNLASVAQRFVVNPPLAFTLGEFLAIPADRALDRPGAFSGGTLPLTFTTTQGALPDGLSLAPGEFRFVGTPTAPGSAAFTLEGVDAAGSGDTVETTAVVCVPFGTADLAAGGAACGWWFDAALGSKVKVGVKTAKKQPKRSLRVVVIGTDGTTEVPAVVKAKSGKASVSFTAPASGRFYCVAVGDAGEASQLQASGKLTLPKSGKGDSGDAPFQPGTDLPVEVGALEGTALTFSIKPDKSGLLVRLPYLLDPDGNIVAIAQSDLVEKKGVSSFTRTLDAAGTWTVVLGARPGPAGTFTFAYKLRHPKGGAYAAE